MCSQTAAIIAQRISLTLPVRRSFSEVGSVFEAWSMLRKCIEGHGRSVFSISLILLLTITTPHQLYALERKPTAEQALATIGYLSQKQPKKIRPDILHEDLQLFIKKLVLFAKAKDAAKCLALFKLDHELKNSFETIELKLLLDALTDAAYIIKNRAEKFCSHEEIQQLNTDLNRWCEWATRLVNESLT